MVTLTGVEVLKNTALAQKLLTMATALERTRVAGRQSDRSDRTKFISSGSSIELENDHSYVEFLVSLVASDDEFVRHSAGKTLLALSNYLTLKECSSSWSALLSHLWDALKVACVSANSIDASIEETPRASQEARIVGMSSSEASAKDSRFLANDVAPRLACGASSGRERYPVMCIMDGAKAHQARNWGTVVCVLQILRCILKNCSCEHNGGRNSTHIFFRYFHENVAIVVRRMLPDGWYPEKYVNYTKPLNFHANGGSAHLPLDTSCSDSCALGLPRKLAWGACLQLLCSSVQYLDPETGEGGRQRHGIQYLVVRDLIPMLAWMAQPSHSHYLHTCCISSFLCHKQLMIMLGLSRWFEADRSLALMCLRALRHHWADFINGSLLEKRKEAPSEGENRLDSSFAMSLTRTRGPDLEDRADLVSFLHLQRRALLLLFRIGSLVTKDLIPSKLTGLESTRFPEANGVTGVGPIGASVSELNNPMPNKISGSEPSSRGCFKPRDLGDLQVPWAHSRNSGSSCGLESDTLSGSESSATGEEGKRPHGPSLKNDMYMQEVKRAVWEWVEVQGQCVARVSMIGGLDLDDSSSNAISELSMSLVQLYLDEDDMMLEMLLQLMELAPLLHCPETFESRASSVVAAAFSPMQLFHVFLAVIRYDQTVLVDFLISENTGTLCLRYLMGCAHLIRRTWPDFRGAAPCYNGVASDGASHSSFQMKLLQTSPQVQFRKAITCLMELRLAIERLHRRQLFPYNPSALLRRFEVLEELFQQEQELEPKSLKFSHDLLPG